MRLRDVTLDDLDLYIRMRCDPAMMTELGGPQSVEAMPEKVRKDVASVESDEAWISVILADDNSEAAAGSVVIWSHVDEDKGAISEVGWMVLPEYQGRGIGTAATRMLLKRAATDGRWGLVHAYPSVTNAASNGICRSLGFELIGQVTATAFNNVRLVTNDWRIDPVASARRWA